MSDGSAASPGALLPDPSHALAAAPAWRREPYRLFFPLGLALTWAGVLHWLLHATGVLSDYRSIFHAIAQVQGFMTCFAAGFLLTAIPRRTGTPAPAGWEIAVCLAMPVATTVAAWYQRWAVSQLFWIVLVAVLVRFAVTRFLSARSARRPPNSFVWIPIGFAMGVAGSLLTGTRAIGPEYFWLHYLGQILLLQGLFLGLVMGVGGMVLPLITRGDAPPDAANTEDDQIARLGHLGAAALLVASFWIEARVSLAGGFALRAAVLAAVLLVSARIWRLPRVAGWHRKLVWLSAWMLPLGYALAAVFPAERKAGMHVVFIGGFALMALSVALHVTLAHGGHERLVRGRPWQVPAYGGLILVATALRAVGEFDKMRFLLWLAVSAAAFLLATVFWAWLALPRLKEQPGRPPSPT